LLFEKRKGKEEDTRTCSPAWRKVPSEEIEKQKRMGEEKKKEGKGKADPSSCRALEGKEGARETEDLIAFEPPAQREGCTSRLASRGKKGKGNPKLLQLLRKGGKKKSGLFHKTLKEGGANHLERTKEGGKKKGLDVFLIIYRGRRRIEFVPWPGTGKEGKKEKRRLSWRGSRHCRVYGPYGRNRS